MSCSILLQARVVIWDTRARGLPVVALLFLFGCQFRPSFHSHYVCLYLCAGDRAGGASNHAERILSKVFKFLLFAWGFVCSHVGALAGPGLF